MNRRRQALPATVAVLVAANLATHFVAGPVGQLAVPVAAVVLVVLARWAGLGWQALGMARADWGRGARIGALLAALVALGLVAAALLPATRANLLTERYHVGWASALLSALVLIPLQTAIPEEVAFRGVLYGGLSRRYGERAAIAGSSVLFGLWHITSALGLADGNRGVGDAVGTGVSGRVVAVLGAVGFTAAAGVVFCWLRKRSGSILASIGLHWAANGAGALAAALAWQLSGR